MTFMIIQVPSTLASWKKSMPHSASSRAALLLQWLDFQHAVRTMSTPLYVAIVALLSTVLGIWVSRKLGRRPPGGPFEKNERAMASLGITEREHEVLELLARGQSNREIGETLFVSTNAVKTHLANLDGKLEVSRRTQAIQKARALRIIPRGPGVQPGHFG